MLRRSTTAAAAFSQKSLGTAVTFRALGNRCQSSFSVAQDQKDHSVRHVGVVGAGQMGIGITLVTALTAKLPVLLLDSSRSQLEKQVKFLGIFCWRGTDVMVDVDLLNFRLA